MTLPEAPPGPNVLHQVLTVGTGYGFVSRCGCGWRSLHDTKLDGLVSGQRHVRTHTGDRAK